MVEASLDRTLGDGIGPRTPVGNIRHGDNGDYHAVDDSPFGGRGPGGPPAWFWRDSAGASGWEEGTPPAPTGVWCDEDWRRIA